jgi:hypothetical protein
LTGVLDKDLDGFAIELGAALDGSAHSTGNGNVCTKRGRHDRVVSSHNRHGCWDPLQLG